MRTLIGILGVVMVLAVGGPAMAQSSGSGAMTTDKAMDVVFTTLEKRLIREYYGERSRERHADDDDKSGKKGKKNKEMPPGLAKKESLPPGLARQLQRNGKLPPGLEKRRLPQDLERRLPPRDRRFERVVVDTDVVLIETATNVVLDVLIDVLKKGN